MSKYQEETEEKGILSQRLFGERGSNSYFTPGDSFAGTGPERDKEGEEPYEDVELAVRTKNGGIELIARTTSHDDIEPYRIEGFRVPTQEACRKLVEYINSFVLDEGGE